MPVEVSLNTPLADALNAAILPKLVEVGWGSGGSDDSTLAEYVILMLVNGKSQDQIAAELSNELLSLPPDDPSAREFCSWLFNQIELLNAQLNGGQSGNGGNAMEGTEMDTDMNSNDVSELNAPTGPRSMRNGNRGGRDKRMMGHMSKAMDRSGDVLHRVRGQTGSERINTHGRNAPTGPRGGMRGGRMNNNRAAGIQAGLAGMAGGNHQAPWMMQGQAAGQMGQMGQMSQMELVAMMEQQNQLMFQLQQTLMNGGGNNNFNHQRRGGKPLSERVHDPHRNSRRGQHHAGADGPKPDGAAGEDQDVDMSGNKREPANPDESVCKYNLKCTNKDCKFAHQSPAAPPGTSVDVSDVCSFGAACKNRKCVGRHPSPAQKFAHQSEQDCKFFPNCQNPRCPFRHPSMPLCRNGADCTTPNCKFTHVTTKCKFNPCLNPTCAFAHEEGQQGGFKDKVWTPDGGKEHVSERKFVKEDGSEELIKADGGDDDEAARQEAFAQDTEVIG